MEDATPSLAHLLTRTVDRRSVVAFRREGVALVSHSRADWTAGVATLRDRLADAGLGGGARIALYDDDPYAFSLGLFACWQVGAVAVLPPNVQPGSLERLRESVTVALGSDGAWLPGVPGFALGDEASSDAMSNDFRELDREAAALELFTSGTTGDGKASLKRLRHLDDEVRTLEATFGADLAGARVHATASHQHLYGLLFRVLWPLASLRPFCCDRLLHAEELLPRLVADERSVLASVPAHLVRLVSSTGIAQLSRARCTVFSSGGPLLAETAHAWERASGEAPIEVFGSTETGGVGHRQQRAASGDRVAWTPFAGVELSIDDDASRLRVRSPALSENEDSGFAMGDRARLHADGRFELGGRVDRVVKIGEKRLELAEMESRLRAHPAIESAALTPIEQAGQARIGSVVVPSGLGARMLEAEGRGALGRALVEHLARDFDRVLVPRAWRYVEALPEDEQGKVTASALRALFETGSTATGRPREAAWRTRQTGSGWIELRGRVPEALASLEGHFPGAPIVPGTVQLDWAVELARQLAGYELAPIRVEALKFSASLAPGDECVLRVEQRSSSGAVRIRFRLFDPEEPDAREFASGRVVLVAASSLAESDA